MRLLPARLAHELARLREERGQTLFEYAAVLVLVSIVGVISLTTIGSITTAFIDAANAF